jgi:hypothetical protein
MKNCIGTTNGCPQEAKSLRTVDRQLYFLDNLSHALQLMGEMARFDQPVGDGTGPGSEAFAEGHMEWVAYHEAPSEDDLWEGNFTGGEAEMVRYRIDEAIGEAVRLAQQHDIDATPLNEWLTQGPISPQIRRGADEVIERLTVKLGRQESP